MVKRAKDVRFFVESYEKTLDPDRQIPIPELVAELLPISSALGYDYTKEEIEAAIKKLREQ